VIVVDDCISNYPATAPRTLTSKSNITTFTMAGKILNKDELSNNSFFLNKVNDVSFAEIPKPTLQSDHDVLVAVNYTGICGSDVHYYVHGAIGDFVVKDPMVLGHESAGTIVEVG
jgi:D-xylulose reductase